MANKMLDQLRRLAARARKREGKRKPARFASVANRYEQKRKTA